MAIMIPTPKPKEKILSYLFWLVRVLVGQLRLSLANQRINVLRNDFGSSKGENAVYSMPRLINHLRAIFDAIPLVVCFNDLPTNDFHPLFKNLFLSRQLTFPQEHIYPMIVGGTERRLGLWFLHEPYASSPPSTRLVSRKQNQMHHCQTSFFRCIQAQSPRDWGSLSLRVKWNLSGSKLLMVSSAFTEIEPLS